MYVVNFGIGIKLIMVRWLWIGWLDSVLFYNIVGMGWFNWIMLLFFKIWLEYILELDSFYCVFFRIIEFIGF